MASLLSALSSLATYWNASPFCFTASDASSASACNRADAWAIAVP
eukprot:CAMPEP_0181262036 /NCGR_PEP_ID=MMETSP1097-20121128/1815_1 /TAXON_ID=35684 /ORGANISM="Pseudopedinella elastica, Strain CCMP716" /LENGTH=44 /DNA_ID= /DNA_START= /DNA_END= /DNA_ORIENTATION=